jgi:Sec23/Sec24 zinc finger
MQVSSSDRSQLKSTWSSNLPRRKSGNLTEGRVETMAAPPPPAEAYDPALQEELDGISFSWNTWPTTRIEASRIIVPIGAIYTPLKVRGPELPPVEYPPVQCKCKAILNPFCGIDINSKTWTCQVSAPCRPRSLVVLSFTSAPPCVLFQHSAWEYAFGATASIHHH